MRSLFQHQPFTGFGPHSLTDADAPLFVVQAGRASRLRDRVRRSCPRQPGVYGMIDAAGELIYVGKAKCLRTRLLGYFRRKSRDPKAGRIIADARTVAWEPGPSEFAALLRELELIRRWQPRFNVQGQPKRRRRVYLCLGRKPAPYVFLAAKPPATAFAIFGPVSGVGRAREAVRRVNDLFALRDCPHPQQMVFADQREMFPVLRAAGCIRHEIGTCLGPCAAACTEADYAARVEAARRFLDGIDASPLAALERDMQTAAATEMFERAAILRDKLKELTWLNGHLDRMRQAARQSFIYPVTGDDGGESWYLIHRGCVRAVLPAPLDAASWDRAGRAIHELYRPGSLVPGPPTLEEIDNVLLVAAWFRRHPAERERTWRWDDAARGLCGVGNQ